MKDQNGTDRKPEKKEAAVRHERSHGNAEVKLSVGHDDNTKILLY
jgi:hypothetical protein